MKRFAAWASATIWNIRIAAIAPAAALGFGAWKAVRVIEDASWNAGARRAQFSLGLLLVTLALGAIAASRYRGRNPRRRTLGVAGVLLVCLACFPAVQEQVQWGASRYRSPRLIDIPITTMAAARAIASGQNPYKVPVDPRAESREQGRNYDGFKYMPLMAAAYAPAALAHSDRGVILINAVCHVLMAVLIFLIARSLSGNAAASLGLIFYLWTRIVPRQLFNVGVTDMAAVLPLLAAFLAGDAWPFARGLLVGISVSTKLLPALALVPVFAPAVMPWRDRKALRFWIGLACGCLPAAVFFFWSPADFFSNVVLFTVLRPVDSTSWLDGHAAAWRHVAMGVLFVLLAGGAVLRWIAKMQPRVRVLLILAMIVGMTLLGPVNHGNYQLWWIPWFAIVLAFSLGVYVFPPEPVNLLEPQRDDTCVPRDTAT
jgi:hypothetical protein